MKARATVGRAGTGGAQAFKAHEAMVRERLNNGDLMKQIYDQNRDKFPFVYSNFTRYCRRLLEEDREAAALLRLAAAAAAAALSPMSAAPPEPPRVRPERGSARRAPIVADGETPKTFTHNPVPSRDDLI